MGTQGAGRKRSTNKDKTTAEDDALNLIAREAEARLAAKRAARAEAREIRMKELERQQKEIFQVQKKYYGLSPKADDRQDSKWGDIEQWMEDSERYTRPSRTHTLSDEDERMSVGSRGSVRSDLDIVGAFAGGGDSSSYSLKKSKKKKKHKHKDRNGYDDEYSVISSRSSRVSDESRASRSSRLDLTSSVLAEESRASRASRLDLQPTSYSTSDLYSLNGLSSSRPPVYNGYQLGRSLSQVPQQSYRRSSLYDDGLCSGSRRSAAHAPLDYSSYRSSGSRTSSRASSRAGSARTSPVDNSSSSVASFLRSAVNSGLPRDLDDVTIPDFPDVEDGNYLEKGCRAASALTATTLTSLGGTSSRRGSGETALTLDAETSIREIKEIHELKDQIQDVESKFSQNLKEAKDKLAEVEEKYRKAMVSNAQLDNEKNNLMYQVDTLKDSLMELEEQLAESRREYEDKAKDFEREKHAHTILQFQFNELKETLKQSEELLNEIRQLRIKEEGFHREISDLQETVDWKDKKISALERQKEYTDAIRSERDELREEVVHLKDILKKHGIVLGPDLNINGGLTEALNSDESSTDPNSQTVQETPISPAEGTNSMLGNSEEEAAEANKDPTQVPLPQNQEMHKDIEKQNFEDGVKENDASQVEMCANEDQQKTNIEHLEVVATDQVDGATHFEKSVVEAEPTEHKDIESPENAEVKPTSQDNLEEQIINKEVDSVQVIEAVESEKATEELAKEVQQNEPTVIESKVEIQQEPDAVDVDSEDASAKSKVTSGGGKKKKRKKRGKKKGATSEEQKEQKNGQENQTKSDATAADGGTTMQEGDIAGNGQASKENTSVDDSKDGTPATNPLAEQVGPISDIDKDSETNNSTESNENVELKVEESKSTDEHTQDEDQKNKEIDLVDATKDCTEEVGAMSGIEKDFETNGNDEVEPKVTNAEANLICLETEQADVSSGEATIGTSCILEGTDSANGQENMQSLDNGEQEIQNEASLEMREETGTSVSNIDAEDTNVNPSTSEKEKIVDEVHEKNDDTPSIESEQADTSISDRQVDNPELSVPDSNLEGSLGDVEEPKLLDDCNDKRLDIEEASTFVARDEILNNGECPTLQNVDSSQESTADDAISLGASGTTAVEVIDKVTTEINEIDKDKDAENKDSTVVDDELRSSEIEPDDARNLSVKCSNDNDSEETNIASGELKSSEQEVEVDDVLVQEDASSEHLTDGKPNQKGENDTDDLEKVDTAEENTVHVDSKSVIEKLNDPSDEDKVEKPPAHVNVEVGLDGLAEDDSDLNRQDQSLESESQRQGQDAENDHKDLEMFEAEREIAHQDIELPENCDNDLNTEGIKSQNEEEEVEPGVDVSVEDDMKDLIHSELQNDDTEFEDLDLQPTNLAQDDSNDPICQIVDSSENNSTEEDAKPSKTPMGQDADDEEDEAEGLSFDFDDLEMEAAIAESESKNADEEFEVAVEVLADEATVKDDSLEMQREVKSESDDTSKKDDDVVDKGEELAVTNDASLDKIGATSEQALIVPDATPNRSENNNKRSSLTDGGSDLPVIQSKDTPGGQSRQERGADGEQARSGKKSSKKSKGKGKDECKMT